MSARIRSLDDFLLLLKGVKPGRDRQYTALCPEHDDRNRSLSIKQAEDLPMLIELTPDYNEVPTEFEAENEGIDTLTTFTASETTPYTPSTLPNRSVCGKNEWVFLPDGKTLLCPCGKSLKGGELC